MRHSCFLTCGMSQIAGFVTFGSSHPEMTCHDNPCRRLAEEFGSKAMANSVLLNTVDMGVANRLGILCVCVYVARA